jgi:hypothetical protein
VLSALKQGRGLHRTKLFDTCTQMKRVKSQREDLDE